jgi:hypothetical protein
LGFLFLFCATTLVTGRLNLPDLAIIRGTYLKYADNHPSGHNWHQVRSGGGVIGKVVGDLSGPLRVDALSAAAHQSSNVLLCSVSALEGCAAAQAPHNGVRALALISLPSLDTAVPAPPIFQPYAHARKIMPTCSTDPLCENISTHAPTSSTFGFKLAPSLFSAHHAAAKPVQGGGPR